MTPPARPLTVLVIDDQKDCADSLVDVFRAYEFKARAAYTPTEAVIAAAECPPDVIVVDIGLSGMDGYRLAKRLRAQIVNRPLLVAVTGYGGLEDRSREEGFNHHFLKPADPIELLRVLAAHAGADRNPSAGDELVARRHSL